MTKKVLAFALLISLVSSSYTIFAFGIGLQLNSDVSASLTFKTDQVPLIFAVQGSTEGFGISGDYWVLNKTIMSEYPVKWFWGYGGYANLNLSDSSVGFALGARLPIGINASFADGFVEPYLQVVPSLGVSISPFYLPDWGIPVSLGVRLWF